MHTTTILRNRNIIVSFGLQPKHLGINWTMSPQKPEKIKQQGQKVTAIHRINKQTYDVKREKIIAFHSLRKHYNLIIIPL